MSNIEQRIEQWEKMAAEAPDDMAYFSLANAYREGDRHEDAAGAYRKAIELNPGMSRAYQLLGQTLLKLDQNDEAGEILTKGYTIAGERGDVMPQKAIGSLLTEKLGLPLPEVEDFEAKKAAVEASGDTVLDKRSGTAQAKLADPPMRGDMGRYIYAHFGQDTWNEWIGTGTKVINELRLDFGNVAHQEIYEQHMLEWLGITQEDVDAYCKEHPAEA